METLWDFHVIARSVIAMLLDRNAGMKCKQKKKPRYKVDIILHYKFMTNSK